MAHAADAPPRLVVLTSFSELVSQELADAYRREAPGVSLSFIHKKTSAALNHLDRGLGPTPDLVMASALDAFGWMAERDLLVPAGALAAQASPYIEPSLAPYCVPFAQAGYGVMWHRGYLERHGLSPPRDWGALLDPSFTGHVAMSSPARSGTTHVIVESLLQARGWEPGWADLMALGGRLATVTARSFGVPIGIERERFGVGLVVDALAAPVIAGDADIGFAYPSPVTVLPVCTALVRGGAELDEARRFLRFLTSASGQHALATPSLGRYPIDPSAAAGVPGHPLAGLAPGQERLAYDAELSRRRYGLVNALFDHLVTYRLERLREFWARYDELAARVASRVQSGVDTDALTGDRADLASARALATRVPFAAERLTDADLVAQFSRHQPGLMAGAVQREEEAAWGARLDADLTAARALLEALAKRLDASAAVGTPP